MLFNPEKRMDIDHALGNPKEPKIPPHAYMAPFVTGNEQEAPGKFSIPIDDDHKFTVNDYREKLYTDVCAARPLHDHTRARARNCTARLLVTES